MEWRSIETAPEWPPVLFWDGHEICIGVRHSGNWFTKADATWPDNDVQPTHWMPLPPPPVTQRQHDDSSRNEDDR